MTRSKSTILFLNEKKKIFRTKNDTYSNYIIDLRRVITV